MKIVIVGLGVIGGSFAMALKRIGENQVYGVDTDEEVILKAKAMGLIIDGSKHGSKYISNADLVILCIYPHAIPVFLYEHREFFSPGCVITDVAGVKSTIAESIYPLLPVGVDFIPGHPIAGREKMGIDFASDAVFTGANYLLTPLPSNKEENIALLEKIVLQMGFKRVRRITPQEHDEIIAHTSQLPHAMAVALVNSAQGERSKGPFIGDSYRDLTRVAKINAVLWSELFLSNAKYLLLAFKAFRKQLGIIENAIKCNDRTALEEVFRQASAKREKLDD